MKDIYNLYNMCCMEWITLVIRKVQKDNQTGAVKVNIPAEYAKKYDMKPGSYVNFEDAGNTLHITKVVIEGF